MEVVASMRATVPKAAWGCRYGVPSGGEGEAGCGLRGCLRGPLRAGESEQEPTPWTRPRDGHGETSAFLNFLEFGASPFLTFFQSQKMVPGGLPFFFLRDNTPVPLSLSMPNPSSPLQFAHFWFVNQVPTAFF